MTSPAPINTRYTLSLLSSHSTDSSPSLLVTFDSHRYLFNTPESISRVCVQNKIGMKKMGNVFLDRLEASTGLPGFVLSMVEAGSRELELVGPEGLEHFVASCRFFTRREQLSLKITTPPPISSTTPLTSLPPPVHADRNLVVYALPLSPSPSSPAPPPSSPSTLKRKRSSTSPSPPPRSKSPPPPASTSEHVQATAAPLFDPTSPTFNPSHLTGPSASLWRTMVLRDMFRGKAFIHESELSTLGTWTNPYLSSAPPSNGRRLQSPAYLPMPLPPPSEKNDGKVEETVVSYLAIGPKLRGAFKPEEARKRGVKPGAAFARLTKGERVWVTKKARDAVGKEGEEKEGERKKETKKERGERMKKEREEERLVVEGEGEGEWVEARECMEEGEEASAFLILNIPSPSYLSSLASLPTTLLTSLPSSANLLTIFYFLGPSVLADPRLQAFITSFDPSLNISHRISSADLTNEGNNPLTFVPSALLSLRLSYLDPTMFSLPIYSLPSPSSSSSLPSSTHLLATNDRFSNLHVPLPAATGTDYRTFNFLVPSAEAELEASRLKGAEKSEEVQRRAGEAWSAFVEQAGVVKDEVQRLGKERQERVEKGERSVSPGDDLRVTPLGTGSAIPSKYRNVSSTLLHLPPAEGKEPAYVLLDAGEGTWGQLCRRFGLEGAREVLRGVKLLFISHLHQDHHAGLTTIMRERSQLDPPPTDPLTIIGPPGVRVYLHEQNHLFDLGLDAAKRASARGREVKFVDSGVVEPGRVGREGDWRIDVINDLKSLLGLTEVLAVPVLHRCRCWGLVITHQSGWKAAFSGDTMPCDALVEAGQGASLLIHEATIQDDMPEVAHAKGHSTFGQAIDVARRMKARHLLLTHFSARYPKLPPLTRPSASSSDSSIEPTVAIAFDLATLRLDEFWKMEHYREAMDTLFGWDEAEEDGEVLKSLAREVKSAKMEGKVGEQGMVVDEVGK